MKDDQKTAAPKTEQELIQEYLDAYGRLCKDLGFTIFSYPAFKLRDDGTFSVVVQSEVQRISQNPGAK